jgi:hypothetical protein
VTSVLFTPSGVIATIAAKLVLVIPNAEMSNKSWPPAGLKSKPFMVSLPNPAAKMNVSCPSPPVIWSSPSPPVIRSLPVPPSMMSLPPRASILSAPLPAMMVFPHGRTAE